MHQWRHHQDAIMLDLVSRLGHWGYLVVFLGVALESALLLGVIIPAETMVLAGGFLAAHGILDWRELMIWVCLGAVLGDSMGYELGRRVGHQRLLRAGRRIHLRPEQLESGESFFRHHGGKAVFLGRFMAFMRALIPFVAGSSGLRYRHFLAYNAVGGILWGIGFVAIGYFAGTAWRTVGAWIGVASGALGVIIFPIIAAIWLRRSVGHRRVSSLKGADHA